MSSPTLSGIRLQKDVGKRIPPGSVPFSSHIAVTIIKSVMVCFLLSDLIVILSPATTEIGCLFALLVEKVWLFLGEDILEGVGLDICF